MNTTHPADLSPLSFGPGLAFGLMLLRRRSGRATGLGVDDAAPEQGAVEPGVAPVGRVGCTRPSLTASGRR